MTHGLGMEKIFGSDPRLDAEGLEPPTLSV